MNRMRINLLRGLVAALILSLLALGGCKSAESGNAPVKAESQSAEQVAKATGKVIKTVTWVSSWYTSWSMAMASVEFGDIDPREGELGTLERQYSVDIVMVRQDYMTSLGTYQTGQGDCVNATNTDAPSMAVARKKLVGDASVVLRATSVSVGADIFKVVDSIKTWEDVYGVVIELDEFSVSRFLIWYGCTHDPLCDYTKLRFHANDPVSAANNFANRSGDIQAWIGWAPEIFTISDKRPDVRDFYTSAQLPNKYMITDTLICGQKVLDTVEGQAAVHVLSKAQDNMWDRVKNPETKLAALKAVSKHFSGHRGELIERGFALSLIMNEAEGREALDNDLARSNVPIVQQFALVHKLIEKEVDVAWGTKSEYPNAVLRFDTSYLK